MPGKKLSRPELRCLAMNLPQGIQPDEISMLMDEYTVFQLDTTLERAERIEEYWQIAFDIKKCMVHPSTQFLIRW